MDLCDENSDLNPKYLLSQLNTARKEINNLRQQIKSLRYIHEKDVENIRRLLEFHKHNMPEVKQRVTSLESLKPGTSSNGDTITLKPIGIISTWFPKKRGTPRQPGICQNAPGKLTLYNSVFTNPDHAVEGLQGFSHMWILFHFHKNESTHVHAKVAPPRLNGIRTGVFSTRSPHRPCPIGLSLVKIIKIENHIIYFEGVDMVDQTPVLDIKPYIPMYDNPEYIDILNNRQTLPVANDASGIACSMDLITSTNEGLSTTDDDSALTSSLRLGNLSPESQYRYSPSDVLDVDVSRDEEIALRLQAEEFQGDSDYESSNTSRNFYHSSESASASENNTDSETQGISRLIHTISNVNASLESAVEQNALVFSESQNEHDGDISTRLQNINLGNQNSMETQVFRSNDTNFIESHASRNSRLLDGADGPSTVCGRDLDLINRRSLHSRVDNSPVRMGVREAPDGEEGLQSQGLTPVQNLPDNQIVATASNTNVAVSTDVLSTAVTQITRTDNSFSEVRVPDWISKPNTATLSVMFNERALIQLQEILDDKADEKKHAIENVLREDPRSVYLRQRWGNQFYTFLIHDLHITCRFDDNRGVVTVFQVRHAGRTCECGEPEWQCVGHTPSS